MYKCKYCNKECTIKAFRNHEVRCKHNPDRLDPATWATGNRRGLKSWNSGLVGDIRCKTATPDSRKKMSESAKMKNLNESEEIKKKRSNTIVAKVRDGLWHTSLARHMHIQYNGVDLHGSWEVSYARYLDQHNIKWIRNTDSFLYYFEDKYRRYTPDFYLPESGEYVEIKGYKTDKDNAKWSQFPKDKTLIVLMHKELKELEIIP